MTSLPHTGCVPQGNKVLHTQFAMKSLRGGLPTSIPTPDKLVPVPSSEKWGTYPPGPPAGTLLLHLGAGCPLEPPLCRLPEHWGISFPSSIHHLAQTEDSGILHFSYHLSVYQAPLLT